jgi:hypothetical protein
MKYILVSVLAISPMCSPQVCYADFSGFSMTESPVASVESIIDEVLTNSKLENKMAAQPKDFENLRSALIKGSLKDNEVLRSIVKVRNDILPGIKNLPEDQQLREYAYSQDYLKSTAEEFGYNERVAAYNH